MSQYIPGYGNSSAKLMVIADAPSKKDTENQRCFSGAQGDFLKNMLELGGVKIDNLYFTNVVKYQLPQGKIDNLHMLGKSLEENCLPELENEIQTIKPNCILSLGKLALETLTGHKKLNNWRGSILPHIKFALPKILPTFNPSSILYGEKNDDGGVFKYRDKIYIQLDINRAIKQSTFPEYRLPPHNLHYARNSADVYSFLNRFSDRIEYPYAALDIETYKTYPMCLGIAFTEFEACCVPFFNIDGPRNSIIIPPHDMREIWQMIAEMLYDDTLKKIGHNFKFDQERLEQRLKMIVRGFTFDTQLAWHCLYPELLKSLAFQNSICTETPYWKDEGKEYNPKKDDPSKWLLYCAMDSVITYKLAILHMEEMRSLILR